MPISVPIQTFIPEISEMVVQCFRLLEQFNPVPCFSTAQVLDFPLR
jgi:hypothetical protein